MKIFKRMRITASELSRLRDELDDYIWAAMDCRRGIISAGDEYIEELRDVLMTRRSHPEDIYCFGFDMATGRIDYLSRINRRNPTTSDRGEVHALYEQRIETLLHYFFEELPIYQIENRSQRGVRRLVAASI